METESRQIRFQGSPEIPGMYLAAVRSWIDGTLEVRRLRWNGVDWLDEDHRELTPRVVSWKI